MSRALGLEQPPHHAHGMGRRHADRLVEHQPAVHVALLAAALLGLLGNLVVVNFCQLSLPVSSFVLPRSRWTAGVRKSFSIRSASANRSSIRKRISGANLRLTCRAISPRRYFLLRSSAASTASASRPPSGIT